MTNVCTRASYELGKYIELARNRVRIGKDWEVVEEELFEAIDDLNWYKCLPPNDLAEKFKELRRAKDNIKKSFILTEMEERIIL